MRINQFNPSVELTKESGKMEKVRLTAVSVLVSNLSVEYYCP